MAVTATDPVHETVNAVYLSESRRVLATLIRVLGDFDAAEEALHDAFRAALEQWPRDGVPSNPRAWLVSAGRFKAIDAMRRRKRFDQLDDDVDEADVAVVDHAAWADEETLEDDRLRLIFTCCHPALAPDAQVALTLRDRRWRSESSARRRRSATRGFHIRCRSRLSSRSGSTLCCAWCIWSSTRATRPRPARR